MKTLIEDVFPKALVGFHCMKAVCSYICVYFNSLRCHCRSFIPSLFCFNTHLIHKFCQPSCAMAIIDSITYFLMIVVILLLDFENYSWIGLVHTIFVSLFFHCLISNNCIFVTYIDMLL